MEPISQDEWNNLSACYWNCADNVFLAGTTPNETFYEANKYKDRDFYLTITAKETSVEKKVSQTIIADFIDSGISFSSIEILITRFILYFSA